MHENPTSTHNLLDIFVGVDIRKSFHRAAAINASGTVLLKPRKVMVSSEDFMAFEGCLDQLGDKTTILIGLEASGHYWMSLWRILLERGWRVEVFNPVLSSQSARSHLRGRKTDADDALFIARTVRDGDFTPFQPGNQESEQLKLLCRQRRFVGHELTNAKRRLTGLIGIFPSLVIILRITTAKRPSLCSKWLPARALLAGFLCAGLRACSSG